MYFGVKNVCALPELATWALMIGGLGAAGGAIRQKRRSATSRSELLPA